jgi:hypothetical protein
MDRCGREFFEEAWDEFFCWEDVPEHVADSPEFETMFVPWFVFSYVADPHMPDRPGHWPEEPIGRAYLWEHGAKLPEDDRRFIDRACRSPLSFFAVVAARPGVDIRLRDILTGREFDVLERHASSDLPAGSILFTSVVSFDDGAIMCGASPYLIPPSWQTRLIDLREGFKKRRLFGAADLSEYDIELREAYLEIAHELTHPTPPRITNTDGDPLELSTLIFELRIPLTSAYERLKPLTLSADDDELLADAQRDEHGGLRDVVLHWNKAGNRKHKHWDATLLGRLHLTPGRLTAEVNSRKRATRLERLLKKHLGDDARLLDSKVVGMEELAARMSRESGSLQAREREMTPELREAAAMARDQQWDAWLDERVPALKNTTPRKAARTAAGRERLEALLAEFAWRNDHAPVGARVDVAALRRKLGLGG